MSTSSPLTVPGALASYRARRTLSAVKSGAVSLPALLQRAAVARSGSGGEPTYASQLATKAEQVRSVLSRYTTLGPVPASAVEDAIAAIHAWQEKNSSLWSRIEQKLLPMDDTVPAADALAMPPQLLRAYAEGLYASATTLLTWYSDGIWSELVANGTFTSAYVRDDASARLGMLDAVLALEDTGALAAAYGATKAERGVGLGSPYVAGGLIVLGIVVGLVALVVSVKDFRQAEVTSTMMVKQCDAWIATGDPRFKGSCEQKKDSDLVQIAKYGILTGVLGLVGYALAGQAPRLWKEIRS